ncbi:MULTISPECIES: hypothetical protein [Streptomyces]|uniref:hypothetical protein n=1 Tax=Streptomyces TaxID=1883 RepID=UPI000BE2F87D|nr:MULTISPECIES: hypothetical protein [Streptomyces]MDX2553135.1 hypothetical protein [Streptomyces stelliscabiei]MDX2612123.1 hypothetical protein [Streptomyces stelliscabiei]MDX2636461.1 hypothetical protein [Streptomyces stelliscabiei]MDX2663212.1 hypothetical protein [Streptomyces stelliscabiei]MDX2714307.1 hypothetical protein [Streptomyces stelliscabiei]
MSVLGDGTEMGVVLCASDDVAARLAEVQYTLGEGPCMEAVRLRAPVFATLGAYAALRRVRLTETVHALVTRGIAPATFVEARTPH